LTKIQEVEAPSSESFSSLKESVREKDLLLEAYDEEQARVKNISLKNLLYVYITIFVVLALILPKIYISNQIYYTSKEITQLYHTYTALKEEHAHLQRELELIRYQLEVLDDIEQP
jgi:cell division protein FtsL